MYKRHVLTSAAHGASHTSARLRWCSVNKPLSSIDRTWMVMPAAAERTRLSARQRDEWSVDAGEWCREAGCARTAEAAEVFRKAAAPWRQCPADTAEAAPPRTAASAGWVWAHRGETRRASSQVEEYRDPGVVFQNKRLYLKRTQEGFDSVAAKCGTV